MKNKQFWVLVGAFLFAAVLILSYPKFFTFDLNILSVLNRDYYDGNVQVAFQRYEEKTASKVVMLVKGKDVEHSIAESEKIYKKLSDSEYFINVRLKNAQLKKEIYEYYQKFQQNLLTEMQMDLIERQQFQVLKEKALRELYSPFSLGAAQFKRDPFLLLRDFFGKLSPPVDLMPYEQYLITSAKNPSVFITAEIVPTQDEMALQFLANEKHKLRPAELYFSSAKFYGVSGKKQAQRESTIFSFISISLILGLFYWYFRSLRHFFVALSGILLCSGLALYITTLILGPIHIVAVILGGSIVGIMIDYFIHYFFLEIEGEFSSAKKAFQAIKRPMSWSLGTSLIGFIVFCFAPLSMLKQFSLFSILTLILTFMAVKFYLKIFFRPDSGACVRADIRLYNEEIMSSMKGQKIIFILAFLFLISLVKIMSSPLNNSIRNFANRDNFLATQEEQIKSELGLSFQYEFFIVKGVDEQALLENEELLTKQLGQKKIAYSSLASWVPSFGQQKRSQGLYQKLLPLALQLFESLGTKNIEEFKREQSSVSEELIDYPTWANVFLANEIKNQWAGKINGAYYSIVPLYRESAISDLSELNSENWVYLNKIEFINKDIQSFSKFLIFGALAFVMILFSILIYLFGRKEAMFILTPPLMAIVLAMAIVSLFPSGISIFSLFGAILILCLGLDYSFFYFFNRSQTKLMAKSIELSVLTTLCSFGMLSFSSTYAVSSFGLVVLIGIGICWLLVPITVRDRC